MHDDRADAPSIPSEIRALVARYHEHRETYEQQTYNETQARREFIDPFFAALGWDIDNRAGLAEAYKDVIHEDAIKIGGATKAPDYCFRIGGTRKFFVEAKKPSIGVSNDPGPAYQVRRYAWTSKLPLSIVTDFQEFAVYDCRIPPKPTDKATVARIFYCAFDQYAEKWTEIASIFSKDAVLKGSFDKYAESNRRKKGTAEVDAEFLKEIEDWREALAKNFALRNDDLSVRDLNFAVERTIDRIIFLRMCEDRGIEPYGKLQALLNGSAIYARLAALFREADDKYNAGLFYFRQEADRGPPDELTLGLTLDDKILKQIIARLYYPESPYEFSVLPTEILGQVYEQFLGKVIRLTAGHRAVIEEKPEVRKAGGVYYTPTYIVDYIVKNTVGKLLGPIPSPYKGEGKGGVNVPSPYKGEGKGGVNVPSPLEGEGQGGVSPELSPRFPTPADVGPDRETKSGKSKKLPKSAKMLRVLDPACGSGSFLLGAYQFLLDWHRDYYVSHSAPANIPSPLEGEGKGGVAILPLPTGEGRGEGSLFRDRLYQSHGGHWRLTIREKKRILLNNIYGVDIDPQAVEVTKLSLLLKVLEGETAETIGSTLRLFHERALPDLSHNIKCGNSLIGPDFYENRQMDMFDDDERRRINVFDWKSEFPEVFPLPLGEGRGEGRSEISNVKSATPDSGFDAVIGNPPYVRQESLSEFKDYFEKHYEAFNGVADLYAYFMEQGLRLLCDGGLFSIIVSSSFLRATYGEPLRKTLKKNAAVLGIVDFGGLAVFAKAKDTYVCIPLLAKGTKQTRVEVSKPDSLEIRELTEYVSTNHFTIPHDRLSLGAWALKSDEEASVFAKVVDAGQPLGDYVERRFFRGVTSGLNEAFIINAETKQSLIATDKRSAELIHPLLGGEDIRRYYYRETGLWLIFTRRGVDIDRYPAIREHLEKWKEDLTPRKEKNAKRGRKPGRYKWYEIQDDVAYYGVFDKPKLIFPDICKNPRFCLDLGGHFLTNTAYCLGTNDSYLLGVLNSRLFWFAISNISIPFGTRAGQYRYRLIYQYMEKVPIRVIDFSNPVDRGLHDRVVSLVDQMTALPQSLAAAKTDHDKTTLQRQIDATDRQIDQLVYQLYALTPDEIRIVEEATQ